MGSGEGQADQSNEMSASSTQEMPSPRRADFQLPVTDFFLDLDTDRPARKTRCLKLDHEGRVISEDERTDQADRTWGQKGPSSKSFRDGSLGAGTAISTIGAGMKKSDHTKWWSEGVGGNWSGGGGAPSSPREE